MEGIFAIWQRDLMKFIRDRARLLGSFAMPILFLIIFGGGFSGTMENLVMNQTSEIENFNYLTFIFPGIVAMTLLMTSIFSSLSVIQDKEFGYMKEILVSPVSRVNIAIGKMLGASTVAFMQGVLMFILIPVLGVTYEWSNVLAVLPIMFLLSCTLASLGLLIASLLRSTQGFQLIVQVLVFPMVFLSGALFPVTNMPAWMDILVKVNPVTYGVDAMKKVMTGAGDLPVAAQNALGLNLQLFGRTVTVAEELLFLIIFTSILIALATVSFRRANA
ncbi:ABC transporter permease [Marinococcus halophilus]|uniref:ABC transporter permease n=1 Tax=Marinococcus halophilus TaxID=1371 RepID=UPI0009A6312C|nr:ABC transporter permease [Marinococcus halophilus]